jgi:small ligand-binding sensory domain FIST
MLMQGCKNLGRPFVVTNKFGILMPNICGSAVWKLLHAAILAPRILKQIALEM